MAVAHERFTRPWLVGYAGMVVGLWVTAASMSSGFIWAAQGKVIHVYVAGFFAWTGYVTAHYAAIGVFVDEVTAGGDEAGHGGDPDRSLAGRLRAILPAEPGRAVGFLVGIAVLVAGIAILAWFVRQENHLLGNFGSGLFLAGYVLAHYFDAGVPL
jgi:hypothetical protein